MTAGGGDVIVIGGGVAGLACALYLTRAGARVTVVESNRTGSGASSGNAGWLSPAQAGPLPEPGVLSVGVRAIVDRSSPLYLAPRALPALTPWLVRFARACTPRAYAAGARALATLGRGVFASVDALVADGLDVELHKRGLVAVAQREATAGRFLASVQPMAGAVRVPDRALGPVELRALEPGLTDRSRAAVHVEQHWHVRPEQFTARLAGMVRDLGVTTLEGAEVRDLELDGRSVTVRTAAGTLRAGHVVLAAGAWTPALARMAGLRIPVAAGKGYSFTVEPGVPLEHAVLLLDEHVGCSPLANGRVRIAGTMEFSGLNSRLDHRRIGPIVAGARAALGPWRSGPADLWAGLRPIAPDGLPIIDRVPGSETMSIATAYSMLGMTLALPAAQELAAFIATGRRPEVLEPFRADRFG
jgi:D-amino-acid dehydrogenase